MAHRYLSLLVLGLLLAGCAPVVTYADVQRTAQAIGCWPNRPAYPTPPPVTVTPPPGSVFPTAPSPTALPSTTPYPRCPAAPGEALAPWPTPVPPQPPYPTMADTRAGGGSGQKTTLHLPEVVLTTDIAVHPTEGWPAVAAAVWSGNDNPERAFVSVYHPATRTWTPAHQVDIGPSALGRFTRTVEVAISGDGVIHAVWGMSDPDFSDNDPPAGVWAAESRDYGESWSQPRLIGPGCRQVNDLAASLAGWLVAGLVCNAGAERVQPAIATRAPDGTWSLERLPGAIWYFSDGAVALSETADGPQVTVAFLTGPNGAVTPPPRMLRFTRHLATSTTWLSQSLDIVIPGVETGGRTWHARALVYRPHAAGSDAITFLFSDADRWQVYAITSQDAGRTWLPAELVVAPAAANERIAFAAPAYDPVGQRLAAIWTCCAEGSLQVRDPTTHYLRWSLAGSGVWADVTPQQRVPLITGARASGELVTAQARNARTVWITWIEDGNKVEVRSFDLATVLPEP